MDAARELLEELRRVRADLDGFDVRIAKLERGGATDLATRVASLESRVAPWRYSMPGVTRYRRRTVAAMREQGLSMAAIAGALGIAVATVQRDLDCTPHSVPTRVIGLDHKSHPAHKNGHPQA